MGWNLFKKRPQQKGKSAETSQITQSPFSESHQKQASGTEVPIDTNPPPTTKWWQEGELTSYKSGKDIDTFVFPQEGGQSKPTEINVTDSYDASQSLQDDQGVFKPEVRGKIFRRRVSSSELINSNRQGGEKKG